MQNKGAIAIVLLSALILVGLFSAIYFWLMNEKSPFGSIDELNAANAEKTVSESMVKLDPADPQSLWEIQPMIDLGEAGIEPLMKRANNPDPATQWAVVVGLNTIRRDLKDQTQITDQMKRFYDSETRAIQIYAAASNAEQGDYSGLPILLNALESDTIMLFIEPPRSEGAFANRVLEFISGQDYGYDEAKDSTERDLAIQQWKDDQFSND